MLRVYFLQQWFSLSDPGVEDALYESPVLRRFPGIDLGRAPVPDETTILKTPSSKPSHVAQCYARSSADSFAIHALFRFPTLYFRPMIDA